MSPIPLFQCCFTHHFIFYRNWFYLIRLICEKTQPWLWEGYMSPFRTIKCPNIFCKDCRFPYGPNSRKDKVTIVLINSFYLHSAAYKSYVFAIYNHCLFPVLRKIVTRYLRPSHDHMEPDLKPHWHCMLDKYWMEILNKVKLNPTSCSITQHSVRTRRL
jgi:hypothetical protein